MDGLLKLNDKRYTVDELTSKHLSKWGMTITGDQPIWKVYLKSLQTACLDRRLYLGHEPVKWVHEFLKLLDEIEQTGLETYGKLFKFMEDYRLIVLKYMDLTLYQSSDISIIAKAISHQMILFHLAHKALKEGILNYDEKNISKSKRPNRDMPHNDQTYLRKMNILLTLYVHCQLSIYRNYKYITGDEEKIISKGKDVAENICSTAVFFLDNRSELVLEALFLSKSYHDSFYKLIYNMVLERTIKKSIGETYLNDLCGYLVNILAIKVYKLTTKEPTPMLEFLIKYAKKNINPPHDIIDIIKKKFFNSDAAVPRKKSRVTDYLLNSQYSVIDKVEKYLKMVQYQIPDGPRNYELEASKLIRFELKVNGCEDWISKDRSHCCTYAIKPIYFYLMESPEYDYVREYCSKYGIVYRKTVLSTLTRLYIDHYDLSRCCMCFRNPFYLMREQKWPDFMEADPKFNDFFYEMKKLIAFCGIYVDISRKDKCLHVKELIKEFEKDADSLSCNLKDLSLSREEEVNLDCSRVSTLVFNIEPHTNDLPLESLAELDDFFNEIPDLKSPGGEQSAQLLLDEIASHLTKHEQSDIFLSDQENFPTTFDIVDQGELYDETILITDDKIEEQLENNVRELFRLENNYDCYLNFDELELLMSDKFSEEEFNQKDSAHITYELKPKEPVKSISGNLFHPKVLNNKQIVEVQKQTEITEQMRADEFLVEPETLIPKTFTKNDDQDDLVLPLSKIRRKEQTNLLISENTYFSYKEVKETVYLVSNVTCENDPSKERDLLFPKISDENKTNKSMKNLVTSENTIITNSKDLNDILISKALTDSNSMLDKTNFVTDTKVICDFNDNKSETNLEGPVSHSKPESLAANLNDENTNKATIPAAEKLNSRQNYKINLLTTKQFSEDLSKPDSLVNEKHIEEHIINKSYCMDNVPTKNVPLNNVHPIKLKLKKIDEIVHVLSRDNNSIKEPPFSQVNHREFTKSSKKYKSYEESRLEEVGPLEKTIVDNGADEIVPRKPIYKINSKQTIRNTNLKFVRSKKVSSTHVPLRLDLSHEEKNKSQDINHKIIANDTLISKKQNSLIQFAEKMLESKREFVENSVRQVSEHKLGNSIPAKKFRSNSSKSSTKKNLEVDPSSILTVNESNKEQQICSGHPHCRCIHCEESYSDKPTSKTEGSLISQMDFKDLPPRKRKLDIFSDQPSVGPVSLPSNQQIKQLNEQKYIIMSLMNTHPPGHPVLGAYKRAISSLLSAVDQAVDKTNHAPNELITKAPLITSPWRQRHKIPVFESPASLAESIKERIRLLQSIERSEEENHYTDTSNPQIQIETRIISPNSSFIPFYPKASSQFVGQSITSSPVTSLSPINTFYPPPKPPSSFHISHSDIPQITDISSPAKCPSIPHKTTTSSKLSSKTPKPSKKMSAVKNQSLRPDITSNSAMRPFIPPPFPNNNLPFFGYPNRLWPSFPGDLGYCNQPKTHQPRHTFAT